MRLSPRLLLQISRQSKMPILRVVTSLSSQKVPSDFEASLPKVIGDIMHKEPSKFWVELKTDARLSAGGSTDPAVFIYVKSIGCVGPTETPKLAEHITNLCAEKLNLPKDKIGIEFFDLDPTKIAKGGTTMAQQLGK